MGRWQLWPDANSSLTLNPARCLEPAQGGGSPPALISLPAPNLEVADQAHEGVGDCPPDPIIAAVWLPT